MLISILICCPLLITGLVIIVIVLINEHKEDCLRQKQKQINEKVNQAISSSDFKPTRAFYLSDCLSYNKDYTFKKAMYINNDTKQLALVDYRAASVVFTDFSDLLDYEIYENGTTYTVGGAVSGMFVGGFSAERRGKCRDLRLNIRLNNIEHPQISYDIIPITDIDLSLNKTSKGYRICISSLQEMVSILEIIKKQNKEKKIPIKKPPV